VAGERKGLAPKSLQGTEISQHPPRELVGRDTSARYQVQFRAAALECLKILDRSVSRVYCDVHDDYVSATSHGNGTLYRFYQVKTKGKRNHLWSSAELIAIGKQRKKAAPKAKSKARKDAKSSDHEAGVAQGPIDGEAPAVPRIVDPDQLANVNGSFLGHLLRHAVTFGDACELVTLQTNVGLDDDVEAFVADIQNESPSHPTSVLLVNSLSAVYGVSPPLTKAQSLACLRKLRVDPNLSYLALEDADFDARAHGAIFKYSEIDLTYTESSEIAKNVRELVHRKSCEKLPDRITGEALDAIASVDIDDLLDILSISKEAYRELVTHDDPKALRSVSIIQRKLRQAKLSEEMVEHASRWKVEWDDWYRTHARTDIHLAVLSEDIHSIYLRWCAHELTFSDLQIEITSLHKKSSSTPIGATLSPELLLGGVFAALVKGASR
jgi:hypothetical protein